MKSDLPEPQLSDSSRTQNVKDTKLLANSNGDRFKSVRHFKALMKKNWINWKRTLLGSIFEVLGAVLLTLILVWARTEVDPEPYPLFDFYMLQKPFYPTQFEDPNTPGKMSNQNIEFTKHGQRVGPFMSNSDYLLNIDTPVGPLYQPLIDFLGPLYFFPQTCFSRGKWRNSSNIIAYLPQENEVHQAVLDQLKELMQKQRYLKRFVGQLRRIIEPQDPNKKGYRPVTNLEIISLFFELMRGARNAEEQLELLQAFGIPSPVVQFLATQTNDNQLLTPQEVTLILEQTIENTQENVAVVTTAIAQQIQQTQQIIQTATVNEAIALFNLDETQAEEFALFLSSLFSPAFQGALQTEVLTISEELGLTSEQEQQMQQLLNDFQNTQNQQLIEPAAQLTSLLTGAVSLAQFNQESSVDQLAQQLSLTEEQQAQVNTIASVQQDIIILTQIRDAINNNQPVSDVAEQQNIPLSMAQILELGLQAEQTITPLRTTQILDLNQQTSDSLFSALQGASNEELSNQLGPQLGLTSEETLKLNEILSVEASDEQQVQQKQDSFFELLRSTQSVQNVGEGALNVPLANLLLFPIPTPFETSEDAEFSAVDLVADSLGLDEQTRNTLKMASGEQPFNATSLVSLLNPFAQGNNELQQEYENGELKLQGSVRPQQIWSNVDNSLFGNFTFMEFPDHQSIEDYVQSPDYMLTEDNEGICFAFQVIENAQNDYELELMFNDLGPRGSHKAIPSQRRPAADPTKAEPDANSYMQYQLGGFNQMVNLAANTVLRSKTIPSAQITSIVTPIKQEAIMIDGIKILLQLAMTLFFLLMYIPLLYRTVYRIVFEKVTKAKESMRIMGMTDTPYWLSWWCYYTIVNIMVTTGGWSCLMINVFSRESGPILWMIIFLFGESLFGILLIAQSIFQAPRAAAITTTIVYFGTTFIGSAVDPEDTPWLNKAICCMFLPQVAMIQTVQVFIEYESSGIAMTTETWHLEKENYTVKQGLFQQFGAGLIILLLGLYLEQVLPKTYGQKKHPLFCLGFPCKKKNKNEKKIFTKIDTDRLDTDNFDTQYLKPENFEPAPREVQQKELSQKLLKVSNLRKVYDNGFRAVNGMNLKMYADQIFVLLGHNGAGKTTTISMLTGLLQQSEGEASVFGYDLFNDMQSVRKFMGVCPQHDVLFELLTVKEHLSFFYDLKGGDPKLKEQEIEQLMVDFGIKDKQNALAYTLSGGNKRKLSVAISLCGNSKFVLLDEPTAGMDLQARRQLWNQLKLYKKDRIIVLTTHYMDEADILGDRIGIMTKGKMTCLGSSIFLKNKFGVGYNLTVVKTTQSKNTLLMQYLQENLGKEVILQTEIQQEMTIRIPQQLSQKFAEFFAEFDKKLEELNILSYGISISTLEEVFLRIGHLEDPTGNQSFSEFSSKDLPEIKDSRPSSAASGFQINNKEPQSQDEDQPQSNNRNSLLMRSADRLSVGSNTPSLQKGDNRANSETPLSQEATSKGLTGSLWNFKQQSIDSEKLSEKFESYDFNLKDNQKDLDTSFWNVLAAVLIRRFHNYRRNKKALFNEAILPCMIILFGFVISYLTPSFRSISTIQGIERLPQPQHILINQLPISGPGGQQVIQQLVDNIAPGKNGEEFIVRFDDEQTNDIRSFGQRVFDLGLDVANDRKPPWLYGSYLVYKADTEKHDYQFNSFVNLTSQDASMLYPTFMYESIIKTAAQDPDFKFKVRSTPFPPTYEFMYRVSSVNSGLIIFVGAIAFAVCMTFVVSYLVVERKEGLKHLQEISGMKLKAYWAGNFIVDYIKLQLPIITIVICFKCFDMGMDTSWIIYTLFPLGALPFCYITSFLFSADSAAQTFTMFFHFFVVAVLGTVIFALRIVPQQQKNGDTMNYAFKAIPTYILASSVYCDSACEVLATARETQAKQKGSLSTGGPLESDPWHISNNLMDMFLPFGHFILYFFILYLIEIGAFSWIRFRPNRAISREARDLDSDVVKEASRVQDLEEDEAIQVKKLKKVYSLKTKNCLPQALVAVSDLSFALKEGECFALLGVNGAGKSTTFKTLTQEVKPTGGQIKIAGYDIKNQFDKARKLVGYCPQPNLIYEYMTVEQHLIYYARIKGIPKNLRTQMVNKVIKQLGLEEHRSKSAGTLSGGNKRKLCVGIALVGNPPIILLDEPSAGMDPEARRFMWSVVAKIAENKTSAIVLTTHSMDEAEALSTKMGIMVKGGIFKCFGTAQHIKNKFGTGYVIEVKIRDHTDDEMPTLVDQYFDRITDDDINLKLEEQTDFDQRVIQIIKERLSTVEGVAEKRRELYFQINLYKTVGALCDIFSQVEVIEHYGNYMRLRVQRQDKSIGFTFGKVELLKTKFDMSSYSVSQTTLEQIFQGFADVTFNENAVKFEKVVQLQESRLTVSDVDQSINKMPELSELKASNN